jgi:hypothetical protein
VCLPTSNGQAPRNWCRRQLRDVYRLGILLYVATNVRLVDPALMR